MKIKVDEDLPKSATIFLQGKGYDAISAKEHGMNGWKDPDLWKVVQKENRLLITADKGFADIRVYPPKTHHGVLLLRPDNDGIKPILELLQKTIESCNLNELEGKLTVVTTRGIRIRKD